jgi:hypothetical protein
LLAGGVIAEAEIRSWTVFAWPVAAYTVGCLIPPVQTTQAPTAVQIGAVNGMTIAVRYQPAWSAQASSQVARRRSRFRRPAARSPRRLRFSIKWAP